MSPENEDIRKLGKEGKIRRRKRRSEYEILVTIVCTFYK